MKPKNLLVVAIGTVSIVSLAHGDPAPDVGDRMHNAVGVIVDQIGFVTKLKAKAERDGLAIKASCIDDKLQRLRQALDGARSVERGWPLAQKNPAFAQRSMDRMDLMVVTASAFTEEARNCTDAHDLKFQLEVTPPPFVGSPPPGWPVQTPPTFERPPLASPY